VFSTADPKQPVAHFGKRTLRTSENSSRNCLNPARTYLQAHAHPTLCESCVRLSTPFIGGQVKICEEKKEQPASLPRARRVLVLMPNMRKAKTRGEPHVIAVQPSMKNQGCRLLRVLCRRDWEKIQRKSSAWRMARSRVERVSLHKSRAFYVDEAGATQPPSSLTDRNSVPAALRFRLDYRLAAKWPI
jgi:hypothetical protein